MGYMFCREVEVSKLVLDLRSGSWRDSRVGREEEILARGVRLLSW